MIFKGVLVMKYDQTKVRMTTLRLQDEILDVLKELNLKWFKEAKRHTDGSQVSISCVIRCLLTLTIPIIEEMDEVRNEEDFMTQLSAHIS